MYAQSKLELITGIPIQNQEISVLPSEDATQPLCVLADDSRPLGFYGVHDWQVLKVSNLRCHEKRRLFMITASTSGGGLEPSYIFHRPALRHVPG